MSAKAVALLLAVALGAACWALWGLRGRVDTSQQAIDRLKATSAAYADSLAVARAATDSLERLVVAQADSFRAERRRFVIRSTPTGPVAVVEGDATAHPIPVPVAEAIRHCEVALPACQQGLMQATAALTFAAQQHTADSTALAIAEARPPQKPRFGFQAGLAGGIILTLVVLLVAQ